ncbi:MAG: ABC transporter ATP-binding protein [Eubacteriales bacterium]
MKKLIYLIKKSIDKFLLKQIKCVAVILGSSMMTLIFPYYMGKLIDQLASGEEIYAAILPYLFMMLCSGMLAALLQYIQNVSIYKIQQEFSIGIKKNVYNKCVNGNWNFWNKWKAGDALQILGEDIAQLENMLVIILGTLLANMVLIFGITAVLVWYNPYIGLISIILCFLLALCQEKIGKLIQIKSVELRNDVEINASFKNETLNNMPSFTMSGLGNVLKIKFMKQTDYLARKAVSLVKLISLGRYFGTVYNYIIICISIIIGIFQIDKGQMTVGQLYTITIFVQRLYAPIVSFGEAYMAIKKSIPISERTYKLLEDLDEIEQKGNSFDTKINSIKLSNVSFSYDMEGILLREIKFEVFDGQILGIVGENGMGKSTLFRLLLKKCKCTKGYININEVNIDEIDIQYLYNNISIMTQESNLLSGTIRQILNPFDKKIDDEKMYYVLNNLLFDIDKLPNGLNTYIHPNMTNLSGGEKQKLNLARVILENKPLILLDEPTSALDLESEERICDLLQDFLQDKMAIIITHRKNILRICTSVVQL